MQRDEQIRIIKDVYWEDWGRYVKVFEAGEIIRAKVYYENGEIESASARSEFYDVSDIIYPEYFEVIK
jgi:hypothetical protein